MRSITAVALASVLLLAGCGGDEPSESEKDQAVAAAESAFEDAEAAGDDLSEGPCISESLPGLDDWVADVAHDPREDVDDDPSNQCRRYRDGEADHFVELTPEGELIRAE
ncbi:MAG TPA: hypothetical protein VFL56_00940 [Solirubrobacterales bacterium]|nr:hypothetical protein [Solirubrobacterales bacterium]